MTKNNAMCWQSRFISRLDGEVEKGSGRGYNAVTGAKLLTQPNAKELKR